MRSETPPTEYALLPNRASGGFGPDDCSCHTTITDRMDSGNFPRTRLWVVPVRTDPAIAFITAGPLVGNIEEFDFLVVGPGSGLEVANVAAN